MKVVTTRVNEDIFENIKYLMKAERVEQGELVRRLLGRAVMEEKLKLALEQLKTHKVSLRKAAELAGVSYVEMFDAASEADVDSGYSVEDVKSFETR